MKELLKHIICLTALLATSLLSGADTPLPDLRRSRISAPPIYSGDGTIVIFSSQSHAAYRAPILVFVNRTRELFQGGLNLNLGSLKCPLEIRIGDKSDGDTSVLTARLRDEQGNLHERIDLPDPEAADLTRFRRAVAVAFLRAWMVDSGGTDETMKDLPNWLIDGMMRYLEGVHRQEDFDRTYQLWTEGHLPVADKLYSFDSATAYAEPAVAAVLAGWFLEKRGRAFKVLLKNAATGTEWSSEMVAELLVEGFSGSFDRMMDLRMLDLGCRVIIPGITTAGIVSRFCSELLLFPSDYGMMFNQTNACCTFKDAVALPESDALKEAARAQALKIRVASAGRDGTLLAVSEQYEKFLVALAAGSEPAQLMPLLMQAESMRRDLESRVGSGHVLKRKNFEDENEQKR